MRMTSSLQRWECPSSARVLAKLHIPSLDIAIQEVLTRQNWAERYSASRYTHRLQFHVSPNSGVFKIHGFWHSWKGPSSPNDPLASDGPLDFFQTPLASGWTAFGENPFWKMTPAQQIRETEQPHKIFICFVKWFPFLCIVLGPVGPIVQPPINSVASSQVRHRASSNP